MPFAPPNTPHPLTPTHPPTHTHPHPHTHTPTHPPQALRALYPPGGGPGAVELVADDVEHLQEEEFLNDTSIDFWLRVLQARSFVFGLLQVFVFGILGGFWGRLLPP